MSEDRPTFRRKSRPRIDPDERARMIAEFAALSGEATPTAYDMPHISNPIDDAHIAPEPEALATPKQAPVSDQPAELAPEAAPQPAATTNTAPDRPIAADPEPAPQPHATPSLIWGDLGIIPVDPAHLENNLIITAGRHDPAHGAFDVLRTRLVQALFENDWKRVGITSPTRDCGKTFTAVNLAISLSRYETNRTVLMDMDMRNPSVADVLGAPDPASMGDFLQGRVTPSNYFMRLGRNALNIGSNLAVGLNNKVEPYAAELIQDPLTDAAFSRMMRELDPDVVLYDLPPALAYDDVIAFKRHFDGILMVVGGGKTTTDEIHESMRRIGDDVPLLGVVLNQAEGDRNMEYNYG